ncbi:MAG: helix-turn-helix transcriptional regulator [Caldisericaceae bacterium]|nr:helix-turn-helix transcriptional regulator [Caldisericaceae bacterium]
MKYRKKCANFGLKSGNILLAGLLFLLIGKPTYGYILVGRLKDIGINPSFVPYSIAYRLLHNMEIEGLVISKWDVEVAGPSKRVYSITDKGVQYLKEWMVEAHKNVEVIENLIGKIEEAVNEQNK